MGLNGQGIRIVQIQRFKYSQVGNMSQNGTDEPRCEVGASVYAKAGHVLKANGSINTFGTLCSIVWLNGTVLRVIES